jgi:hypothetical protein
MFVHTVFFWLNPGATEAQRKQLMDDCRDYLGEIPAVQGIWVGVPAMTPRDVVDNSYGVGLTVLLENAAGHDEYQAHQLHLDFIARNKETWNRVQIYDFVG